MAVSRDIRFQFTVEDKLSDTMKKLASRSVKLSDGMKTVVERTRAWEKVGNQTRVTVTQLTTRTKTATRMMKDFGQGMYTVGRRVAWMGFLMSSASRRIVRSLKAVFNMFKNIVTEAADMDKAFSFLSETLEALALAGTLTSDKLSLTLSVFNEMFDNARAIGGELAELNLKFQSLKNEVAERTIPFLEDLNDALDRVDWDAFKEKIGDATTAFLGPLSDAILEILSDENLGALGAKLETLGALAGTFSAGFITGIDEMLQSLVDIDLLAGTEGQPGGLEGLAFSAGNVVAKMSAIAIPAIFIGGAAGTLGMAIKGVAAVIGGPAAWTLAAVVAVILTDFERWATDVGPDLLNAIGDLGNAIGWSDKGGARAFLKGMSTGIEVIVRGIETWIRVLTTVIRKLRTLATLRMTGGGDVGIPEMQRGGPITQTGAYLLHRGEYVVPANRVNNFGGFTINVYESSTPSATGNEVARRVRSLLVIP